MSVKIEDLEIGSIVRLASGSPKMVVTGFGPQRGSPPRYPQPERQTVFVRGWSDRLGLFTAELNPLTLVYPRPTPEIGSDVE